MVGVKDVLLRRKISKFRLKSVGWAYQRKKFDFQMSSGNLTRSSSFCMMYLSRPTGSLSVSLLLSFSKLHSHLHPIVRCLLPNAIKGLGQKANGARPANSTCKMHPICFAVTGIWSDLERRGQQSLGGDSPIHYLVGSPERQPMDLFQEGMKQTGSQD